MNIPIVQLRDLLKRHVRDRRMSQADLAKQVGMSTFSVNRFLTGRTERPHAETVELMEMWLKDEGVLSRLGLPTTPLEIEGKPTETDRSILRDMGIGQPVDAEEEEDVPLTQLNRLEKSVVIQGIMNSRCLGNDEKLRIITHLFPTL